MIRTSALILALALVAAPAWSHVACEVVQSPVLLCDDTVQWVPTGRIIDSDPSRILAGRDLTNAVVVSQQLPDGQALGPDEVEAYIIEYRKELHGVDQEALTILDRQPQPFNDDTWITLAYTRDRDGAPQTRLTTAGWANGYLIQVSTVVIDTSEVSDQHHADHLRVVSLLRIEG